VGIERVTRRRLQRTLAEGLRESETVTQLSDRVHRVLGGNRLRANRIARTEAGQAVSTARFLSASAAGASGKGWRHGPNPRPSHVAAQVRYDPSRGKPIPLDQAFQVGRDNLMYPRDPAGSAGEIINCNCVMISVRLRATDSERAA
jgi:hypothetical protein